MLPSKLVKIKNLGNSFMTITGGWCEKGAIVSVREWEFKLLSKTRNVVEVTEEPKKTKKSK